MTPKQRVQAALRRQPVDRLPVQTNYTRKMGQRLAAHFGIPPDRLGSWLDNHLLRLELAPPPHPGPDPLIEVDWWGAGWDTQTEGYWHRLAPLANRDDLDKFPWPNPNDPHLLEPAFRELAADAQEHFAVPNFGMCLFERAWSLRGFDRLLMDLIERPDWVEDLLERITSILLVLARRSIELGVHGAYFGDDYGAQHGMLFSPEIWRRLFKPRLARLFAVFRQAGLPVILHSDGDIWAILPDLVEIGVDCLNPVQPEVLDHARLYREYGDRLSFYGGLSTQSVLPVGTAEVIEQATRTTVQTLAADHTGLLLGPSHRMQSDIPPENVVIMLEAFQKLKI